MKQLLVTFAFAFCIFATTSCDSPSSGEHEKILIDLLNKNDLKLTEELIEKYIIAYRKLKALGPNIAEEFNKNGFNPLTQYQQIEQIIVESGFDSYAQFVKTNARIAWAFSLAQGHAGKERFSKLQSDSEQLLIEQINNPDVPEEVKVELRKNLKTLQDNWKKNAPWADYSLKIISHLTSDEDTRLIMKYEKELLELFAGVPMPEVPQMKM
ncbi:MAG: hypothetical protein ACPGJS_21445 [Flammeovirgaceae bacterium]